ncbi:hypothetical protein [Campylobacter gastrosuis]|uniref:Uncharacterized protein n=1 Tax=Campylobacter gastrosuis TaxID=2974576 RepID=A0ABT7HTP0_9BACT|nr:hypothetical protein [Campylobacter gastrosuis]MDL0089988.1 hypothetical protein [Campylobacter gastrosuis]
MKEKAVEKHQFIIHYYLIDETHSINTFIKNGIEKDFLNIINTINYELNINITLESKIAQNGGYIEVLDIIENHPVSSTLIASATAYTIRQIVEIVKYFLSGKHKRNELENRKLELEILKLEQENTKNTMDINNQLKQKLARPLSNYYTKIEKYEKIKAVGFGETTNNEYIVQRSEFKNFILIDDKETEIDDEANIELISPVLKEGRYKWRGIYNGKNIEFSMGDSKFKDDIINGRYDFGNGSFINCQLYITKTYDDFGNEVKNKTYRVAKVYEIKRDVFNDWISTHKGLIRKKTNFKNNIKSQNLFSDSDYKEV